MKKDFLFMLKVSELWCRGFFSLDHHNYARWIPIHIQDMERLPASIQKEFEEYGHCMGYTENHKEIFSYAI